MNENQSILRGFSNAESRWARFGPYYAMFPLDFAFEVVEKYSDVGDSIIDPFAGRFSSVYAGSVLERDSVGIEINPVGWLYGKVKLNPADKNDVIDRLAEIYYKKNYYNRAAKQMPEFYQMCFCQDVLKFLLFARNNLNWLKNKVDSTLMAFIILYLHGKIGEGLSNQMKITKSMGVNYSINWWKEKKLINPPTINPFEFLRKRIEWRYEKGKPNTNCSSVILGDSCQELKSVMKKEQKFSLLFTSPPYYSVTNYYNDQWLRLWMLGGPELPEPIDDDHKGRFMSKENYYNLIDNVFGSCSKMMKDQSSVYVRTDKREFTLNTTIDILKKHFPYHKIIKKNKPFHKKTQTLIHGNKSNETGEVDLILQN